MKRPPSSSAAAAPVPVAAADPVWLKVLAGAAFVLLAAAMTVRPILGEMWTVQITQLVNPSPLWWNTSPAVMYISHLIAAAGLLLGVLWVALKRQSWRFTGLEPAILLLVLAAVLSVSAASDKRVAINVAIGTILPIIAAAVLVQMLASRPVWRRALLAALVAAAVANCWRSTRQQVYEYEDTWQHYVKNKEAFWAKQGKTLDDPTIAIFESRIKAHQPSGYFYHPNVMASFLLLGIAGAAAGIPGVGRSLRRLAGARADRVVRPDPLQPAARDPRHSTRPAQPSAVRGTCGREAYPHLFVWAVVSLLALAGIILWQLVVIRWVGSVGAKVGIGVGVATGLIVWLLGKRPRTAALVCLAMLAGLQISLMVLAARADTTVPAMVQRGGKLKSLAFRLDYWHGAMELFASHPIRGVGPGQFGTAYPAVKPIRAAEEVAHPHNWLLGVAAEWGIFGLLGTLVALLGPAWLLLRPRPADVSSDTASGTRDSEQAPQPNGQALLLGWTIVFICWLIFLPGVVPAGSAVFQVETLPSLPLALVAAALVSIPAAQGLAGRVVLLAGLAAFFAHATVEMSSGVAGATWPFWALFALALSWPTARGGDAGTSAMAPTHRRILRPALVLAGLASLTVLVLTAGPMQAIWAMSQAKNAFDSTRATNAEAPLLQAAEADRWDPNSRSALSEFYRRMAHANRKQSTAYLRQSVQWEQAAVDLDSGSHTRWHDLAWLSAEYASATGDFAVVEQAISAMRRAVAIYPNWPRGHMGLAILLGGASEPPLYRPDLLRQALAEFDVARRLDEQWPAEDPNKFDAKDLDDLQARRQRVLQKLQTTPAGSPAASPG